MGRSLFGGEYDEYRPLLRLQEGDKAYIYVDNDGKYIGCGRRGADYFRKKYGHIPNGRYEATVVGHLTLECKEYPELSGKYCSWWGQKHGCACVGIHADAK